MRGWPGTEVHRERLAEDEVTHRYGIACTSPQRAAFDAARWAPGLRSAVAVLDMALAPGLLGSTALRQYLAGRTGWPGVRQAARALDLANERSRSPQETTLRLVWLLDARLPPPRCNWPVGDADGKFIGSPDLLSEELAVVGEFDGAVVDRMRAAVGRARASSTPRT